MKFKDRIYNELNHIPDFINTTNLTHHSVWEMMTLINETLLELISLKVLSKIKIGGIVRRFNDYVTYTLCLLETELKLRFSIYYTSVIEWILDECVKGEYFESAENINKFSKLYFMILDNET